MTAPNDTREAVEAMAQWHHQQAADYGWHHAKHSLRDQHAATGEMLARLLARAEAAEAALATARADALRDVVRLMGRCIRSRRARHPLPHPRAGDAA